MKWEWDTDKNTTDDLWICATGKKIGILGHDDGGKSVLFYLIKDRKIRTDLGATDKLEPKRMLKINFKYNKSYQKPILIKEIVDTPGDKERPYPRQKVFKEHDYIIYLLRSDLLLAHNKNIGFTEKMKQQRASLKNSLKQDFSNF